MLKDFLVLIAVVTIVQLMTVYLPTIGGLYLTQSILIIAGLAALIIGGDRLVDGAVAIAHHYGVSPLLVGLTVVAMGTSMPELFVNMIAALRGESGLLVANIVGSNISNLLLIGGTASIITPLLVGSNTLRKEIPISLGATALLGFLVIGVSPGFLARREAALLFAGFAGFVYYVYGQFQTQTQTDTATQKKLSTHELILSALLVVGGVAGLYVGGNTLVDAATTMAQTAGRSPLLIGASIVAIGTSVPELVTSVIAALKRQADLAIGNIIGSNIFNILWIGSITSLIRPTAVPTDVGQDIGFLMIVTVILFAVVSLNKQKSLTRPLGIIFVLLYVSYLGFLVWRG